MKSDLWIFAAAALSLAISGPARAQPEGDEPESAEEGDDEPDGEGEGEGDEGEDEPEPEPGKVDAGPGVTASGSSTSKETDTDKADLTRDTEEVVDEGPKGPDKKRKNIPWITRWRPERNNVEFGISAGVFIPAQDHDLYDPRTRPPEPLWQAGPDISLRLGYYPLRPLGVEVEFSGNPTRVRSIQDDPVFVYGFRGHVVAQLPFSSIVPFFLAGYGLMGVRSNIILLGNDIDPAFHYGGGIKIHVSRHVGFRVEARNIITAAEARQDSGTSHIQVLGGLAFTFVRGKEKAPTPRPAPPDPDIDKDGIFNEIDDCPETPGLEPHGCPDTDGDGFIDPKDECPEVPGIAPKGCPDKDSDEDGYLDSVDDCPFEPENFNQYEDEDGCPDVKPIEKFEGELQGIEFEFGKAEIRDVSKPKLDEVVAAMKAKSYVKIKIVGHTDNKGGKRFNQKLSEDRAAAVKQYLVDAGVDDARVQTEGKGQTQPKVPNTSDENRAINRRIEIVITQRVKPE